jgi:hypothetical protein
MSKVKIQKSKIQVKIKKFLNTFNFLLELLNSNF